MRDGRLKWWAIGAVLLLLIAIIFATSEDRQAVSFPEAMVREVLAPFQIVSSSMGRWIYHTASTLRNLTDLPREVESLRLENNELRAEVHQLKGMARENAVLRQALALQKEPSARLVAAEVIARPPSNWFGHMTINRGHKDGVQAGMAVIAPPGVVGHVRDVTANTATVLLIVDPRSAVGALVQRTGDLVLIEGAAMSGTAQARLRPLAPDSVLEIGDVVETSGLSQIFPKGLPIGRVVNLKESDYGFLQEADIAPFVDFHRLEVVFVVREGSVDFHRTDDGKDRVGDDAGVVDMSSPEATVFPSGDDAKDILRGGES